MLVALPQGQFLLEFALALHEPEGADHEAVVSEEDVHLVDGGLVLDLQHHVVGLASPQADQLVVLPKPEDTLRKVWSKDSLVKFISSSRNSPLSLLVMTY